MIYLILEYFFMIFDSGLAIVFFLSFNGYEFKEKPAIIFLFPVLFFVTVKSNESFSVLSILISIVLSFFSLLFCKFNRKSKIRCFWSCVLFYGLLMIVNSLVYVFFQAILSLKVNDMAESVNMSVAISLIAKILLLLTLIIYIKIQKHFEGRNKGENIFYILFLSIFNIVIIIMLMQILTEDLSEVIILLMLGLLISEVVQYYMYAKLCGRVNIEQENEMLRVKNCNIREVYTEKIMRYKETVKESHDMKNHLIQLVYYIKNKYYDKAEKCIGNILEKLLMPSFHIGIENDSLNFILMHKTQEAKLKGIDIVAHIEDIKKSEIEEYDLYALLGNILDNAIEGSEEDNKGRIMVEIYNLSGYQVFSVKNKITKSVLNSNPKLSSRKENKLAHGYGLKSIYEIVLKYQGIIDIYEKDCFFNVKVLIPRKSNTNII